MKSNFSQIVTVAFAAWLGLVSGIGNAGVMTITPWDGSVETGYNASFWNTGVASSFIDFVSFGFPAGSSGIGDANVISLSSRSFTNVQLTSFTLWESLSGVLSTGVISDSGTQATLSFLGGQVPGDYTLRVAGYKINTALAGSYSGNIAISPVSAVPEPETYAMLIAGLGLIGFMARRREDFND